VDLIKCPECGKEISNQAAACTHCGCPIPSSHIIRFAGRRKQPNGATSGETPREKAISLLRNYEPNFLVRFFKSGFISKFIGMTIAFIAAGRFGDADMEIIMPILGGCIVLLWLGSLYPMVHFKGYCRKHHIDKVIRADTGYMNVAINAFNALPTKKTLAYIRKLNPAAAQEIERQLAEKKKK